MGTLIDLPLVAVSDVFHQKRMNALYLMESLRRVAEACRRPDMDRTSFYEWKRRFQMHGLEGLREPSRVAAPLVRGEPAREEIIQQIVEAAFQHPGWGCMRIANHLKSQGISVRPARVQKILMRQRLGSKFERLLKLEEKIVTDRLQLTAEQMRLIEKINPCFRDRHDVSDRPGQLLAQDTCYLGKLEGIGKIYLQAIVDMHGCYAFGTLHLRPQPDEGVALLYNEVLPFFAERGLRVEAILTDNGREFCGDDVHPFELFLSLCDIEHRVARTRNPYANGFIERFYRIAADEFVRPIASKNFETLDEAQLRFDEWLYGYNHKRAMRGYPTMGKCPADTIEAFSHTLRIA